MRGLIDIHCHLLPGVDDGPSDIEEAGRLLDDMADEGIRGMIVTPHYRRGMFEASPERIRKAYHYMKREAEKRGMRMYLGCEYYREMDLADTIARKKRPLMAGTDYVLVEFAPEDIFLTIRNQIYALVMKGYNPIIAHVERYECCKELDYVRELQEVGAYIQINAGSVLGKNGRKTKKYVKRLMEEDLVDFIASDAHDRRHRKPNLAKCASYVERCFGKNYARRIFVLNPYNILKSRRKL